MPELARRFALTLLLSQVGLLAGCGKAPATVKPTATESETAPYAATAAVYAGSASCRECHAAAFAGWQHSQHALAERDMDSTMDAEAFAAGEVSHGTSSTVLERDGDQYLMTLDTPTGRRKIPAQRAIGITPLVQYLAEIRPGELQAVELAWDPARKDWFDVFGDEDRRPGEWGHWSGRGMNWNSMCANCHNTNLQKNYDAVADTYRTTMVEKGVGCESCHGPASAHVTWHREKPADKTAGPKLASTPVVDRCAMCHARRTELTGSYHAGEQFFDHFTPAIPSLVDTWHPDGQVRDEDYEYTSFISSKMGHAGVVCLDCHDPHTAKTKFPDNALCMQCHAPAANPRFAATPAPVIDPDAHSHHKTGTPGSNCVDCHMPLTTYMARDPRRDHGFTIPDPQLTKEHGVPNACSRCHTDKPLDWVISSTESWYGTGIPARPSQQRARIVAAARLDNGRTAAAVTKMLSDEPIPMWRATAATLLQGQAEQPAVQAALIKALDDNHPLVRAMATRALEPLCQSPAVAAAIFPMRKDPTRMVRVEAAWALRSSGSTSDQAALDLDRFLEFNRDQPGGAMQLAALKLDRNQPQAAIAILEKTIKWDPNSPPLRHSLAVAYSTAGNSQAALEQMLQACRLDPRNAQFRFSAGLVHAELNDLAAAIDSFRQAAQLEPRFARAWYNLGLALNQSGNAAEAIAALQRGEAAAPTDPAYPYARATILLQSGRTAEARQAAEQTLRLAPGHREASQLLQSLPR